MQIKFTINGKEIELDVSPKRRLLDILREDLDLTGTKEGCGKGECGACTVLMNGNRVNSCLIPALQLPGSQILTIEGLQHWASFNSLERAYIEHGAVQCGFCMSGFVISSAALLAKFSPALSTERIKWELAGNLCRCTGYSKIMEALEDLSGQAEIIQQIKHDWQNAFGVH